jgi:hypothetical protein
MTGCLNARDGRRPVLTLHQRGDGRKEGVEQAAPNERRGVKAWTLG